MASSPLMMKKTRNSLQGGGQGSATGVKRSRDRGAGCTNKLKGGGSLMELMAESIVDMMRLMEVSTRRWRGSPGRRAERKHRRGHRSGRSRDYGYGWAGDTGMVAMLAGRPRGSSREVLARFRREGQGRSRMPRAQREYGMA